MVIIMKANNKLEFFVPDKYVKCNFYNPTVDDPFIGAIKYLREQGRTCEFLGFNELNQYVVLIDGIKYCGWVKGDIDYYATFYVVGSMEQVNQENRLKDRASRVVDFLIETIF
jgi:hypothetical protein